jgi:hypothetical protein
MLNGDDSNSIRRRNALANALIAAAPAVEKRTVAAVVRSSLYAIAPAYLWQFFSGQGMAGSNKTSFVDHLPNLYKAVLLAIVHITKVDQPSATKGISDVLKTLHTRRESVEFRLSNPSEVTKHLGQSANFTKKPQRRSDVSHVNSANLSREELLIEVQNVLSNAEILGEIVD